MSHLSRRRHWLFTLSLTLLLVGVTASAQRRDYIPALPPPDGPVVMHTAEVPRIRVVPVVGGLSHPWGMAFRQNGDILITERDSGTLRVVRNGLLLDRDIPGVPEVFAGSDRAGLMDVAVHPDDDRIVYLTYSKTVERDGTQGVTVALARGRLDAGALTEVRDIFVAEGLDRGIAASRIVWGPDGKLLMSVGGSYVFADTGSYAQDPGTHFGKLMRLNDDGTAADDNPFVGNPDYLPEIYTMGHRNQLGLAFHPKTGDLWATENGPQGGDEANIIASGQNYGWPIASYSREYSGVRVTDTPFLGRVHRRGGTLVALDRAVRLDVLHGRALPRLAGQPLRRVDDGRSYDSYRPYRAHRLQPPWRRDSPRVAADRPQAAHPRRATGTRWVSLCADRRG